METHLQNVCSNVFKNSDQIERDLRVNAVAEMLLYEKDNNLLHVLNIDMLCRKLVPPRPWSPPHSWSRKRCSCTQISCCWFRVFLRPSPLANFRAGPLVPEIYFYRSCHYFVACSSAASASVYVFYSTRLCYLSQLAPIWRIVHSELDTPQTSARRHEGFCIRHAHPSWQHSDVCGVSNAECKILWIRSLRIVHSELDTPHTFACHHEGFCIRMHILRDNIQMCAEYLMPKAQSFGSELRIVHSELDTPHTFAMSSRRILHSNAHPSLTTWGRVLVRSVLMPNAHFAISIWSLDIELESSSRVQRLRLNTA